MTLRGALYCWARLLGDVQALASGNRRRMGRRVVNKLIGRNMVRRLWR